MANQEVWIVVKTEIKNLHGGIDDEIEDVYSDLKAAKQYVAEKDEEWAKSKSHNTYRWESYRVEGPFVVRHA